MESDEIVCLRVTMQSRNKKHPAKNVYEVYHRGTKYLCPSLKQAIKLMEKIRKNK